MGEKANIPSNYQSPTDICSPDTYVLVGKIFEILSQENSPDGPWGQGIHLLANQLLIGDICVVLALQICNKAFISDNHAFEKSF